jgi:WD40 repeat protein
MAPYAQPEVPEGHAGRVCSTRMAVCGLRLAVGFAVSSIKVWAMAAAKPWAWERTLLGHTASIWSLLGWRGKVVSGSNDRGVRVWDSETGTHDATTDTCWGWRCTGIGSSARHATARSQMTVI